MRDILRRLRNVVPKLLYWDHMRLLGLSPTMRICKRFNTWKYGRIQRYREAIFRERFEDLLAERPVDGPEMELEDGYAIDTSGSLPFLEEVLETADGVIERRGRKRSAKGEWKPYFLQLLEDHEFADYPPLVDFITSPPVVRTVGSYLGFVPVLSRTIPPGIRFMESYAGYEGRAPGELRESQFYHLDHHDSQLMYVIVLLRDVTPECGPFTFLPASASAAAARRLGYQRWGVNYRVPDEAMYACVDRSAAIPFTYPRGTVLFIDTSRCFHYGSRNPVVPRYQLMYALTSACRTDLTEEFRKPGIHAKRDPTVLERLVLGRDFMPDLGLRLPARRVRAAGIEAPTR